MALRRPKTTARQDPFGIEHVERRSALAGATAVIDLGEGSSWKTWKFGNTEWQTEAWRLYDIIGELTKLSGRVGDSVSQARLYVTEVGGDGEEQGEVTDERIKRLAAVPLGTGSQRDDCLRLAGVDLAVGGECWIVGEGAATSPETAEGAWFVVTGAAIKTLGGRISVKRPKQRGGSVLELVDGKDVLIRCWRPHPNDTDQAHSFTRSAIVPLREIELLTKREFAELDSRLTGAGLLFVPEGMDFPRGPDDPEGLAGFMAYIQRAMAASMTSQGDARSMVPIVVSVPDAMMEHIDKIQPLNFWSDLSAEIAPMKDKAIGRVASMAEIPAEVLTGIGDANHWTAWLISEEGTRWIKGYLGLIADALTRGFLQLALTSMGVANPERYAYAFDVSGLAARPNRLEEALQLHDRQLLSDVEVVKAGAFDIEMMPTVPERAAQILLAVVKTQPDLILDPAVQAALGLPEVRSVGLAPTSDQNADGEDPEDEPRAVEGPPNGGDAEEPPQNEARAITAALDRRIAELTATRVIAPPSPATVFNSAAKLMVFRALELAGGRLATPAERAGRWKGVPRHELHVRVGPITPQKAAKVTEGAWTHIPLVADDLGVNADDLDRLLRGYVNELLTRGMAHHDDLLFAALNIANRGRGLMAMDAQDVETFHLPGRHDQSNHGRKGRSTGKGRWSPGQAGHPSWSGMTDSEFEDRASMVQKVIDENRGALSTDKTHTNDLGAWTPERDRLHREIAADLYERDNGVPNEGKAVIAGGLGGAGKTTVLTKHAGIDTSKYMTINPDDIKEELAKRGMIPSVPDAPDLSPMERAVLIHEESSRIAHMLADRAYNEKRNVIWDITMSSRSSVQSRIAALQKAEYGEITGVFVDIPVETSVERAMARYRRGADDYLGGKGFGGRYVPPHIIRAQETGSGTTINRDVFEGLQDSFTDASIYDNSVTGRAPVRVS